MSKKLQILKLFIVTILLAAYSGIYITDYLCLCNLKHPELSTLEQNHNHSKKNHHDENNAGECHNNKNSKPDGCCSNGCNCCKDLTSYFIADLPKLINPTLQFKVKTLNTPFFIHNINIPKHEYITSQFIAYQYKLPPPKIPDIRVFIQSFIL